MKGSNFEIEKENGETDLEQGLRPNTIHRFVPIEHSLDSDAPGYSGASNGDSQKYNDGPICWKCGGTGGKNAKYKKKESKKINHNTEEEKMVCKVCEGRGKLNAKKHRTGQKGRITVVPSPKNWTPLPPLCATNIVEINESSHSYPREDEELCGLISNWRIYQSSKGGHRWTTDDLVTAWVAGKSVKQDTTNLIVDLGCGNGSVLMMNAWRFPNSRCIGIEARSDAINLVTRSVLLNCGHISKIDGKITEDNGDITRKRVSIHHGDFRSIPDGILNGDLCDLVTGTPPYFRVSFDVSDVGEGVQSAVIQEGAMPTCSESAPARCEYRGGIEAYCEAAAKILSSTGRFVVVENELNHERALKAATAASLSVIQIQRVIGKTGKPPLFCVYTFSLSKTSPIETEADLDMANVNRDVPDGNGHNSSSRSNSPCLYAPDLEVRGLDGRYTDAYLKVLKDMNYPYDYPYVS